MIPGTSLMNGTLMGVIYFVWLLYLFLGISIVADIFMEAIEVITSSTKEIEIEDKDGNKVLYEIPVWNATIANLTLLSLGSSAPEILLSIIEALKTLGEDAGELGPSSIVGSGAFNLLIISGISILSVEEPKKIYDLGVYSTTATFSLFAYSWMYICLELWTPGTIGVLEAWLTLFFFFLLVGIAFAADKWQQHKDKVSQSASEIDEKLKEEVLKVKKSSLRM
jgi:solute carrier family 8 (sodium/calcium exchanger)